MKKISLLNLLIILLMAIALTGCNNNSQNTISKEQTEQKGFNTNVNEKLAKLSINTGHKDSKITIIEASDFECPACRSIHKEFKKTVEKYKDSVNFGYIAFPLSYHKNALAAACAVEAANLQEKGWEMHEKLFEQTDLSDEGLKNAANELNLDIEKWENDRNSEQVKNRIQDSINLLNDLNIQGTPTFYINGGEYTGNPSLTNFEKEINNIIK